MATSRTAQQFIYIVILSVVLQALHFVNTEGQEPTLEDTKRDAKNTKRGYELCVISNQQCERGKQFCSLKAKGCQPLFPPDVVTEEQQLNYCNEQRNKTETRQGIYDNCIYYIGLLVIRRAQCFATPRESDFQSQNTVRSLGNESCIYNDSYCQRGKEHCNATSKKCEPLFSDDTSDMKKWQWCQDLVKQNVTINYDDCILIIGLLKNDISHVESFKNCESTENLGTGPAVGIAIGSVFIAIGFIVIGILVCKKKKWLCFKQTTPPQTTPPGENTELQDQNKNNRATENDRNPKRRKFNDDLKEGAPLNPQNTDDSIEIVTTSPN